MSAPQPPNQPWGGGQQPPQGPPSGPQPQQDSPFGSSEPTQAVQPSQSQEEQPFGDNPEQTQVVQPGSGQESGEQQGEGGGAESTQLVAPGSGPQPSIPYAPPPSAADNPAAMNPQGFGQQAPFGQQGAPGGFGAPPQQPPQPGFGQPGGFDPAQGQGGFGAPPPGQPFGAPPGFGGPPRGGGNQLFAWIAGGLVAVLGIIGAILAITLLSDIGAPGGSQVDQAVQQCAQSSGMSEDECRSAIEEQIDSAMSEIPGRIYFYLIMLLVGGVLAAASGVAHALVDKVGAG